jgi:hypothetical protein
VDAVAVGGTGTHEHHEHLLADADLLDGALDLTFAIAVDAQKAAAVGGDLQGGGLKGVQEFKLGLVVGVVELGVALAPLIGQWAGDVGVTAEMIEEDLLAMFVKRALCVHIFNVRRTGGHG